MNILIGIAVLIVALWVISLVLHVFAAILATVFHFILPIALIIVVYAIFRRRSQV